jgi:hypothetical protein
MTADQEAMLMMIIKQNDAVLEMNWQIIQVLVPLEMVEVDDDSEPSRTLQ